MRNLVSAALAGLSVMAFMSFTQPTQSWATPAVAGSCEEATCLLPAQESGAGEQGQVSPRLAKIELNLTIGCPHGFHWNGEECVFGRKHREDRVECPDGMRWDGEDCVRDRKARKRGGGGCVVGHHWNGDRCVPYRGRKGGGGCVVGFHWNGDKCVPDRQGKKKGGSCPEGTEFANGKCRKSEFPPVEGQGGGGGEDDGFSCSHNDHLENGKCVPCKEGFHVEGDECVAD